MEFVIKLNRLSLERKFTCDEEDIYKELMMNPFLPLLLRDISLADVVIVPLPGRARILADLIGSGLRLKYINFPFPVPTRMSFSCDEVSRGSAMSVCGLLRKLFEDRHVQFKGVMSYSVGCGLDNSCGPGPMMWMLMALPGIEFGISKFWPQFSISFADSVTRGCQTEFLSLPEIASGRPIRGEDLILEVYSSFFKEDGSALPQTKDSCFQLLRKFYLIA